MTSLDTGVVADLAATADIHASDVAAVLAAAGGVFPDLAVLADRESERQRELASLDAPLVTLALLDGDVTDLDALRRLSSALVAETDSG
jgi:hypothetical protein